MNFQDILCHKSQTTPYQINSTILHANVWICKDANYVTMYEFKCVCELCAMYRCSESVPKNYVLVLTFQHNFNAQNKPQINDSMHVT